MPTPLAVVSTKQRVVVAMSGGVDSAVTAGLLLEQGYDLIGVTLHLWDASAEKMVGRCCSPTDRDDARRVCEHLGIPHYVIDEREAFRAQVVEPFLDAYASGETPSPCVHCNRTVKISHLVGLAQQFGAEKVATGHYARLVHEGDRVRLFTGLDAGKDQSYFLFGVPQKALSHMLFPLGDTVKGSTRDEALRLDLPNAKKPDSQELCFVPDGDVLGFVGRQRGESHPGNLVDTEGRVLGQHDGIEGFTIGQRRGLRLGGGPARYVLRILPDTSDVVVGEEPGLLHDHLDAKDVHWTSGETPAEPFEASVRVRYRHGGAPGVVYPTATGFRVRFHEPQRAITPGQAAVVYREDEVIGGGFIERFPD